jgi:hypothetical protein
VSKPDTPGMTRVRAVLAAATKPISLREIAKLAHVSFYTADHHYRRQLVDEGAMHVAGWYAHQFGWGQQYAKGKGKTPPKPKAPPPKVSVARWKERTGYVDPRYAHRRLAKPRGVLAALMGLRA